ncbi:HhH-GPD-type base excision DNA repair protein [Agrococcus sp. KRD186]|uniref:HhH-GPD-type base excision DNA repair protein n=1 Tax=Agrococcus sp. KRD186 TaxID=2729730 RepID=UPI0019CF8FB9|nr:HhH-GPD-type base excision DNA repair protein [Agrococcus sp. KRD186]
MTRELHITGDEAADRLLSDDDFALLTGMLLDQQVTMETAFAGPAKLRDRLDGLDASAIARMDPEEFGAAFAEKPAVHRFPGSMAKRVQELAAVIVQEWGGDAGAIWRQADADGEAPSGAEVLRRLKALPGFGEQKAKIFLALLGKQAGFGGAGWADASAPYGEQGAKRSVADIVDPESLAEVRAAKQAAKAAAKAAKG